MSRNLKINDEQHKFLAKLVTLILVEGAWRNVFFSESCYVVRMASIKLNVPPNRVRAYINLSLKKLLGHQYDEIQYTLYTRVNEPDPLKPKKPRKTRRPVQHKNYGPKGPRTLFGKKFEEHYGKMTPELKDTYKQEYGFYRRAGFVRWECNKKGEK